MHSLRKSGLSTSVRAGLLLPTALITSAQRRWCAAAATTNGSASPSPSSAPNTNNSASSASASASASASSASAASYDHKKLLQRYERWLLDQRVDLSKVDISRMDESTGRGLYAKRPILAGEIIVSVPMHNIALSASSLVRYSPTVKRLEPPQLDAIKRAMLIRGMRDPVLYNLMELALVVGAERTNPDSFFSPYFDVLPHPAIADAKVMGLYKDILSAPDILEWGEQRQEFGIVMKKLCDQWAAGKGGKGKGDVVAPPPTTATSPSTTATSYPCPLVVVDWAWRTVLARQHMLPDRGLTPQAVGNSTLNYGSFNTMTIIDNMTLKGKALRALRRAASRVGFISSDDHLAPTADGELYRLMPTLMPVLDQVGHVPHSNCAIEVCPREPNGSCAELQAIRDIGAGEEIGLSYSRAHTAAFTLYRFGFLPV